MMDVIRNCHKMALDLRQKIARLHTTHVNRDDIREHIREVVEGYFRTDRPLFVEEFKSEAIFSGIDTIMQDLLSISQVRTRKSRYIEVLSNLEHEWRDVEAKALPLARKLIGHSPLKATQEAIARTLEGVCPAAATCYRQGLADLSDTYRASWRGTACEFRESLRELLDKLAPDETVARAPGFKVDDGQKVPTMKQKVRFILKSRRWSESQRKPLEDAADVIEEKVGGFVRSVYSGSSSSVHTPSGRADVQSILRFVNTAFQELLELENI